MKWRTSYVSPLCAVTLRDVRSIALDRQWTPGMLCATCGCPSISFIMWNFNVPEIQRISITSFVSIVRPVKFGNYSFEHLGFPNDPTKEIMFFNPICCHKSLTNNCLTHVFIHCPYHDIKILQNSGDSEQARWSMDLLLFTLEVSATRRNPKIIQNLLNFHPLRVISLFRKAGIVRNAQQ